MSGESLGFLFEHMALLAADQEAAQKVRDRERAAEFGLDFAAARHELWKHLNGYVCHLPEADPDWEHYTAAVLRAAQTGATTEEIR